MRCKHANFHYHLEAKIMKIDPFDHSQLVFVIRVWCAHCRELFLFKGPSGYSTEHPTVSIGGSILTIPAMMPIDETKTEHKEPN